MTKKINLNHSKAFETDKRNTFVVDCKYIMLDTKDSLKRLKRVHNFGKLPLLKRLLKNKKEELKLELSSNLESFKEVLLDWAILIRHKELMTKTEYALPIPQIVDTILSWEEKHLSNYEDFEKMVFNLGLENKRVFIEEFVYFYNEYQLSVVESQDYIE